MQPLVSICIPAYNQTDFLKRNLESIALQDFTNYEIVLTDDSTKNDVKKLVDSYSNRLPIRYYHNNPALGSPENWNYAKQLARGKLIKIMHHDDWFSMPNSLTKFVEGYQLNIQSESGIVVSATQIFYIDSNTNENYIKSVDTLNRISNNPELIFRFGNLIGSPSTQLYKKNKIEFDNNLKGLLIWNIICGY